MMTSAVQLNPREDQPLKVASFSHWKPALIGATTLVATYALVHYLPHLFASPSTINPLRITSLQTDLLQGVALAAVFVSTPSLMQYHFNGSDRKSLLEQGKREVQALDSWQREIHRRTKELMEDFPQLEEFMKGNMQENPLGECAIQALHASQEALNRQYRDCFYKHPDLITEENVLSLLLVVRDPGLVAEQQTERLITSPAFEKLVTRLEIKREQSLCDLFNALKTSSKTLSKEEFQEFLFSESQFIQLKSAYQTVSSQKNFSDRPFHFRIGVLLELFAYLHPQDFSSVLKNLQQVRTDRNDFGEYGLHQGVGDVIRRWEKRNVKQENEFRSKLAPKNKLEALQAILKREEEKKLGFNYLRQLAFQDTSSFEKMTSSLPQEVFDFFANDLR